MAGRSDLGDLGGQLCHRPNVEITRPARQRRRADLHCNSHDARFPQADGRSRCTSMIFFIVEGEVTDADDFARRRRLLAGAPD